MIRFLSRFAICALCLATVSVSAGPNDAAAETPAMPVPSTGLPPMAAFAGNSIVSIVDSDTLVMGNTDIRSTWNGRTFFFVNAEEKAAFDANPKAYVSEAAPRFRALRNGVAIGGFCAVCVVDMKMTTPGKQDLTSEVDGKIYLANGEAQPGEVRRALVRDAGDYDLVADLLDRDGTWTAPPGVERPEPRAARERPKSKKKLKVM